MTPVTAEVPERQFQASPESASTVVLSSNKHADAVSKSSAELGVDAVDYGLGRPRTPEYGEYLVLARGRRSGWDQRSGDAC